MKDLSTETFWEEAARTKMGSYLTKIETDFFKEAISNSDYKLVCDVGTGAGKFTLIAVEKNLETVSLDIDLHGLKRLRLYTKKSHLIQADAKALPLKPGVFDAVFSMEVLDYIPETDKVLNEFRTISKDGAGLFFSFGNQSSIKSKIRNMQGKNYMHSYGEVAAGLEKAGYKVLGKTGFNWMLFNRSSENSLIPLLGKLERIIGLRKIVSYSPWVLIKAKLNKQNS
ncbi:MAG: class I SAM-dependent methyltransferase [Candidatus Bathyarchaeota archaeon]|nr:class I SAM-dependent methyltransferase [Candidatus Bathyarchaeota archaeon]